MTIERQYNTQLVHKFFVPVHDVGTICVYNEDRGDRKYSKEKNISKAQKLIKTHKRMIYKQLIERLKYDTIKKYWIDIDLILYPDLVNQDIAKINGDKIITLEIDYLYHIFVYLSNNELKRLKLIDTELYDMINEKSSNKFKKLFPYRC